VPRYRSVIAAVSFLGLTPSVFPADERVDFRRDVMPILSENCFTCHGPDARARKGNLRLDVKEGALRSDDPIIVPGSCDESELIYRVTTADADELMPPQKSGRTLTPQQIETLKRWVEAGAHWGGHWAFEPPRTPLIPPVRIRDWPRNPIDRFIGARLDAEDVNPATEASRTTLIRRVTLDLIGLPPSLEDVEAFVADETDDAYDRLVDRLLASPAHGEQMAVEWLDAARYADTNGYQNDFARTMWPWRDWVIAALNENKPYDQFVIEQMAGDLLPSPTRAQRVATGWLRNNRTVTEAGSIDEEWRVENAVDRVETTATTLLGLTLGCARCHDHKFDPISQDEFYRFFAFFNSVNEKGVYTEQRGNVAPLLPVPSADDESRRERLRAAVDAAERLVRAANEALPVRQKAWEDEQRVAALAVEPADWTLQFPLNGEIGTLSFHGSAVAEWVDGPAGKALKLDGKDDSFAEAGPVEGVERTDHFSYGGWVYPSADGAILSKMDDPGAFRGFDLLVSGGKVEVHLVHAWPGDAIKVASKESLGRDAWTHVFVTYDGSSKAMGLKLYFNGRPVERDVASDSLRESIVTDRPLRIGKRATGLSYNGALADIRFYSRTIPAPEVQALADRAALQIARLPAEERSNVQQELLARFFRDRFATELHMANEAIARARKEMDEHERQIPTVMVMEDAPARRATFVLKRGQYDAPDQARRVEPGVPACLTPLPSNAPANRLGLARWLVGSEQPLAARVAVNRAWQHHFGSGLVRTIENFGIQGEPPTHPELLDWLASELVRTGWDLKALHRLIVTSATYRQASRAAPELRLHDPENRLLARGPRFRLSAEAVRDNALAIAGLLDHRVGGPSVKPYQPDGLWEELAGGAGEGPYVQDKGPNLYRRGLYIYRKRTVPHPALTNFDAPSREFCQVKRPRTDTPLQALALLNDVTHVEAARNLAQLMLTRGGTNADERITFAFRRATARTPTGPEMEVIRAGLERSRQAFAADRESAARFVHHGESRVAEGIDAVELAAYTATASVILNLDETITFE
jgi:hypothetical protein